MQPAARQSTVKISVDQQSQVQCTGNNLAKQAMRTEATVAPGADVEPREQRSQPTSELDDGGENRCLTGGWREA